MQHHILILILLTLSLKPLYPSDVMDLYSQIPEIQKPVEKIAGEGQEIALNCDVNVIDAEALKWFHKDQEIIDDRIEMGSDGFLFIENVTLSDAGEYTCRAVDQLCTKQMSIMLIVRKRTVIKDWKSKYTVGIGKSVKLTCNVVADPLVDWASEWIKGENEENSIANDDRHLISRIDNSLTISNVQESDSDEYTCVVYTKYEKTSESTALIVRNMSNVPEITSVKCVNDEATITYQLNGENSMKYRCLPQYSLNDYPWVNMLYLNSSIESFKMLLRPWTKVVFRISILYDSGKLITSEPSEACIVPPDIPYKSPSEIRTGGTEPNNLVILWKPMSRSDHNGREFHYLISWKQVENETEWNSQTVWDWKQSSITIENQPTFVQYLVKVEAANEIGVSNNTQSFYGFNGEGVPTRAPRNLRVSRVYNSTTVHIVWDAVKLRYINGYPQGYKIYACTGIAQRNFSNCKGFDTSYEGKDKRDETGKPIEVDWKIAYLDGASIGDLNPGTGYSVCILVFNQWYEGPCSKMIKFRTADGIPGRVQSFFPVSIESSTISLKWIGPKQSNGLLIGYIIYFEELVSQNSLNPQQLRISDPKKNVAKLDELKPNTTYRVSIVAITSAGEGESFVIESKTPPDVAPFTWQLLPLDDEFVSVQINWKPNVTESLFFVKFRLKGEEEWMSTNNMSIGNDSTEFIRLKRNQIYELVVVTVDCDRMVESEIKEIVTKISETPREPFIHQNVIILISILLLVFVVVAIWLFFIYSKHKRKNDAELNSRNGQAESGSKRFEMDFGPYLTTDLMSHFEAYEFPCDKLELGEKLGSGAFGVVMSATAQGIIPHEDETRVAVKMVKETANNETLRALALELKMFIQIGKHLNVVNLLGAVTKNFAQRELMVIVEYCPHGNLREFLVGHRDYFIDQIIADKDTIDPTVTTSKKFEESGTNNGYRPHFQPIRTVTTTDLLCWSFQTARGMDYLASRKVLHGDLAARNILLCDNNVVKICDFGLARSMYKMNEYQAKTNRPLPFKWLALESMSDQIFSTYSDVWSFGIVLWELFTLGTVPYPGLEAGQALFETVKAGHRMKKPEYATQDIYDIMMSCWRVKPESRPLFGELEQTIVDLMESGVGEHYVKLNETYLKQNRLTSSQTDYFAVLGCPNFPLPSLENAAFEMSQEFESNFECEKTDTSFYVYNSIYYNMNT